MERKQMKNLIIINGNIGSGKSTLAREYVEKGYICISRDALRYAIGNLKYIFNDKYEPMIFTTEWCMFILFANSGADIVIDENNVSKVMRKDYISYARDLGYKIIGVELPRFTKEECVNRRMENQHGFYTREKWEEIWERFDKIYEELSYDEGVDEIGRG